MGATLLATAADRRRIAQARSGVLMVGSYDGSGNYGDVLQFAAALDTVRALPGAPLPIVVVELSRLAQHCVLVERYPELLTGPAYAYFADGDGALAADGLGEPSGGPALTRTVAYLYGGGYLNGWWGERKVSHLSAAARLIGQPAALVATGLQIDEAAVAPGGVAHGLLAGAASIGLRDIRSLEYARTHLVGSDPCRAELTGDDATPLLAGLRATPEGVVNVHLNDGPWVTGQPAETASRVAGLLQEVGRAAGAGLELQPVIAYEDPHVSERRAVADRLLEAHARELDGFRIAEPVDAVADLQHHRLARFRRARLTVSCSYHLALTSLLAGIPTVLFAENDYYEQKAAGLRHLFQLGEEALGVRGDAGSVSRAARSFLDGPERDALVEQQRRAAAAAVERQDRGRQAAGAALERALRRGGAVASLTQGGRWLYRARGRGRRR